MDCEHNNRTVGLVQEDIAGLHFETPGDICVDCGAQFWTKAIEEHYKAWLNTQGLENPDAFTIEKIKVDPLTYRRLEAVGHIIDKPLEQTAARILNRCASLEYLK